MTKRFTSVLVSCFFLSGCTDFLRKPGSSAFRVVNQPTEVSQNSATRPENDKATGATSNTSASSGAPVANTNGASASSSTTSATSGVTLSGATSAAATSSGSQTTTSASGSLSGASSSTSSVGSQTSSFPSAGSDPAPAAARVFYVMGDASCYTCIATQQIAIDVVFSDKVTVTGTPLLQLETGVNDGFARYASGSGTTTLRFLYTVAQGEDTDRLEYQSRNALTLNGGSIKDANQNNADLLLPHFESMLSLASHSNLVIRAAGPTVSSASPNGVYRVGKMIFIAIEFSSPFAITGQPQLKLNTGSVPAVAKDCSRNYKTLYCNYEVAPGHMSADLDYLSANALSVVGGSLKDALGNDMSLVLPAPGQPGSLSANSAVVVDSTLPTITGIDTLESAGGRISIISGHGFTSTTSVTIGDVPAAVYSVDGPNQISVTIPWAARTGKVIITTPFGSVTSTQTLVIRASVSNVTSPIANGTYGEGTLIPITVTFTLPVFVAAPFPTLTLQFGYSYKNATYVSGSGTNTLNFSYTVGATDSTSDLDYIAGLALNQNGGTILNADGAGAYLNLPAPGAAGSLGANKAIVIIPTPIIVSPTLTGFVPAAGPVGSYVNITGTSLSGATTVLVGGAAATVAVRRDDQLIVTIAKGAVTDRPLPIVINFPAGPLNSAATFTVTSPVVPPVPPPPAPLQDFSSCVVRQEEQYAGELNKVPGRSAPIEQIEKAADLAKIRPNGNYRLTQDIDCALDYCPSMGLRGSVFDGNGHTIRNLTRTVAVPSQGTLTGLRWWWSQVDSSIPGLFCLVFNSDVKNLKLDTVNLIHNDPRTGVSQYAGVGALANVGIGSTFRDITVNKVTSTDIGYRVGGLLGYTETSLFERITIQSPKFNFGSGNVAVGGMVGYVAGSTTINRVKVLDFSPTTYSYATNPIGGVVGYLWPDPYRSTKAEIHISQVEVQGNAGVVGTYYSNFNGPLPSLLTISECKANGDAFPLGSYAQNDIAINDCVINRAANFTYKAIMPSGTSHGSIENVFILPAPGANTAYLQLCEAAPNTIAIPKNNLWLEFLPPSNRRDVIANPVRTCYPLESLSDSAHYASFSDLVWDKTTTPPQLRWLK